MIDPKFKVIAELRNDLAESDRNFILNEIDKRKEQYEIKNIEPHIYCKDTNIEQYNDVGYVAFFFFTLKDHKEFFSKLEYYDLWDNESEIAV